MRQRLITLVAMLTAIVAGTWADGDYQYDPGLYSAEFEMCVSLTDATGGIKSQADLGGGTYTFYAFIGNECRGSATMEETGGNLFQLRVWGNPSDNAKEITFRLVVEENMAAVGKAEYRFPSKNDVYFIEHGRKGYASAPYKIVLFPLSAFPCQPIPSPSILVTRSTCRPSLPLSRQTLWFPILISGMVMNTRSR